MMDEERQALGARYAGQERRHCPARQASCIRASLPDILVTSNLPAMTGIFFHSLP
jgi:hypothetical protein